ncbi:MAG: hypothetical protein LBD68_11260 [Zoogloeaceae bacterium]|nr:hypothetical protein [Zoogloeaceae bacterium]
MPENPAHSEKLAAARNAADTGDWCAFTRVMGGGAVKRRHLPVRVARTRRGERWDYAKGHAYPANPTQYGDEAAAAVYGVLDGLRKVYPSRRNRYAIVQGWSAVGQKRMVFAPWSSVNNCRALAQGKNDNGMTGRDGFNNFSGENANGIGKKVGKDGCCASGYAQGMGEFAPACEGDSRGLSPAFAFGC